ncbi:hypothetical protein [Paracoccus sp. (in: a-proteobacteria)]|uniref:hypothetical protein n=1 Tax=Paracoccus sp. TaxID=267 RepID=UPI002AFE784A|nr:hypothetical protein [Paracoccus sp. (in: a-proteobacteria)]
MPGLDEAQYDACKARFLTIKADREMVSENHEGLIAARTTLQNARDACADRERPNLAPIVAAQSDATQSLNSAHAALAEANAAIEETSGEFQGISG